MIADNEYYYDSDEDDYEDFEDDEIYDPEQYYLSEGKIDSLIHSIRMYGSKHKYEEIEKLILETDEDLVFKWIQDLDDGNQPTFLHIENLLGVSNSTLKTSTLNKQAPPNNKIPENKPPLHENFNKELQFDKIDKELPEYTTILPVSNMDYFDLSPYVNTTEVFQQHIIQLNKEITRILIESNITEPMLLDATLNNEIKALTGYDPKLFPPKTQSASIQSTTITQTPTKLTPTTLTNAPQSVLQTKVVPELELTASKTTTESFTKPTSVPPTAILAGDLKAAVIKVAFQQWRIVIQDAMIQEARLKIAQEKPNGTATQTMSSVSAQLESRKTSTNVVDQLTTRIEATEIQVKAPTRAGLLSNHNNEDQNNKLVPATSAESHKTMAYQATENAHALTNAAWPIASARATIPNILSHSHMKETYKEVLQKHKCNGAQNNINTWRKHKLPTLTLPTTASTIAATISSATMKTTINSTAANLLPTAAAAVSVTSTTPITSIVSVNTLINLSSSSAALKLKHQLTTKHQLAVESASSVITTKSSTKLLQPATTTEKYSLAALPSAKIAQTIQESTTISPIISKEGTTKSTALTIAKSTTD